MKRKGISLDAQQRRALARRAKQLGVPEDELLERALTEFLEKSGEAGISSPAGHADTLKQLQELFDEADAIATSYRFPDNYRFDRAAIYEDDQLQG